MIMNDANWQNQMLLQAISKTQTPWVIDTEVGDLSTDLLPPEPLLTYVRYNAWIDTNGLQKLGLGNLVGKIDSLREMSNGENRFDLAKIGEEAAKIEVQYSHFSDAFNLKTGNV